MAARGAPDKAELGMAEAQPCHWHAPRGLMYSLLPRRAPVAGKDDSADKDVPGRGEGRGLRDDCNADPDLELRAAL